MFALELDKNNRPRILSLQTVPLGKKESSLSSDLRKLNRLYKEVPATECNRCGLCCDGTRDGNPKVYSIEFLAILRFLGSSSNRLLKQKIFAASMMSKAVLEKKKKKKEMKNSGYKGEPSWWVTCPAIDHETRLCSIHEQKPMICRLYGLFRWHKDDKGWTMKDVEAGGCGQVEICGQVKVKEKDYPGSWNYGKKQSLFRRLERLSQYYYLDETEGRIFNSGSIAEWFTLGQKI